MNHFCPGESGTGEWSHRSEDVPSICHYCKEPNEVRRCKCGGKLSEGIAMMQTYVGSPDFPGDTRAMTIHAGGPGELGPCLKCEDCGHSITEP